MHATSLSNPIILSCTLLVILSYSCYLISRMHLTHLDASIVWCACLACVNWVHPNGMDASVGWWSTDTDASNLLKLLAPGSRWMVSWSASTSFSHMAPALRQAHGRGRVKQYRDVVLVTRSRRVRVRSSYTPVGNRGGLFYLPWLQLCVGRLYRAYPVMQSVSFPSPYVSCVCTSLFNARVTGEHSQL